MEIHILKMAKPAHAPVEQMGLEYLKRITGKYRVTSQFIKEDEKKLIRQLSKFSKPYLVCLDETGRQVSSLALAKKMKKLRENSGFDQIVFLIGGPYGLGEDIRKLADETLCLSQLTLTSDMAWLFVVEQIYRSFMILENRAYHHE